MIGRISPRLRVEDSERRPVWLMAMRNCSLIVSVLRRWFPAITGASMQRNSALDKYTGNTLDIFNYEAPSLPSIDRASYFQSFFERGMATSRIGL